jgi:hypothetical protein
MRSCCGAGLSNNTVVMVLCYIYVLCGDTRDCTPSAPSTPSRPVPLHVLLRRCPGLSSAPGGQEWWEAEFDLPAQLFRIDFVVLDKNTGGVDNNKAQVGRAPGAVCCRGWLV